jgi:AcrR family transcriptional regulator
VTPGATDGARVHLAPPVNPRGVTVADVIVSHCVSDDVPKTLPRGPHRLEREVVLASQRGRMLDAIAQVVAEKGYGPATVADVIDRAGVSRKTFYEHFKDKEACFLAAYDAGVEVLLATMRDADRGLTDGHQRTRARVRAYLDTLAAEPAFARTFLIEVAAAGPRALRRRREVHAAVAAFVADGVPLAEGVPAEAPLGAVGATQEVVTRWVEDGRTTELPTLEDAVVHFYLALLHPQPAR